MTKEKVISLTKYMNGTKDRLAEVKAGRVPAKQISRTTSYKRFLERELVAVSAQLDAAKMDDVK